jgi:hypothetical protein
MTKEAMKLALEALETSMYPQQKQLQAITALREALAEQPAQQEPKINIYRSFEQWKSGNVLEHGVPRTEHYSEAQLDLVEMGWNYGYDAGRAVEQALDKKAENARELGLDYEPVWGGGPTNKDYEDAMRQRRLHQLTSPPAQRKPLTDEEIDLLINGRGDEDDDDYIEPTGDGFGLTDADLVRLVRRVEAAHGIKEKNT